MESIETMAKFTEVLRRDPKHAYDFISNNYYKMNKEELAEIVKELLYGIYNNFSSYEAEQLLDDVAAEIDNQYDAAY